MAETLINVFTVAAGAEEEFLCNWRRTTEMFRAMPGFIETHLHRNTGEGDQTFQFVNIARWTSAEAWRDTHARYRPTEYDVPGVRGHPAIFRTAVNVYADDAPAARAPHWIASEPDAA